MQMRDAIIGVIGNGVVGMATAKSYVEHVKEVRIWDKVPEKCTETLERTLACDVVFICLPTPADIENGGLDVSVVDDFLSMLGDTCPSGRYVLKSTMPIGKTRELAHKYKLPLLSHSPEFLTARCATVDAQVPSRNIIGYTSWGQVGTRLEDPLYKLYKARWPHVPIRCVPSDESEAIKLFTNAFFAVKVAFWNEMNRLATAKNLDWDRVMQYVLADGRIHPSHTQVPGPDGLYGCGGACLPKDTSEVVKELKRIPQGGFCFITEVSMYRNVLDRVREVKS